MYMIGCPTKGKLRNIIVITIFAICRFYSNTEELGLEMLVGNSIRSKQSSTILADKWHLPNWDTRSGTIVIKERLGRRSETKHFAEKPKTLEITPRIRMELGGSNIQNDELIKMETNMNISEKGWVHEEVIRFTLFSHNKHDHWLNTSPSTQIPSWLQEQPEGHSQWNVLRWNTLMT